MTDGGRPDRFHVATFTIGVVVTAIGAALLAEGLGWWELRLVDLRYAAPLLLIVIGAAVFARAFTGRKRYDPDDG